MDRGFGIAVLGCGTVGAAVAHALMERGDLLAARAGGPLHLRHVAVRDPGRTRAVDLSGVDVSTDADAVALAEDVDIVVELIGGIDPATRLIGRALDSGRAVVTANKAAIAKSGRHLAEKVRAGSGGLLFEAAVGGAIPVLGTLRGSLRGDRIGRLSGVVNGTTNFMLERMRRGDAYPTALAEAQRRGFAEADPTADVAGWDAAQKLAILAWFAFGAAVTDSDVIRAGIDGLRDDDLAVAAELGCTVRLVARAELDPESGLGLTVQPTVLAHGHPLGELDAAENAVLVEGDLAGPVLLRGQGAGAEPTASAVLSDIVAVARLRRAGAVAELPRANPVEPLSDETAETAALLRIGLLVGDDAPRIAVQMLEDRGVQVQSAVERHQAAGREVVVITRPAARAAIARALETLETVPAIRMVLSRLDYAEAPL